MTTITKIVVTAVLGYFGIINDPIPAPATGLKPNVESYGEAFKFPAAPEDYERIDAFAVLSYNHTNC